MSRDVKGIGQRINELRVAKGWTQMYLAEGICTASMISQVESGKSTMSYDKLKALATKLGVNYLDLIKGHEHMIEGRVQVEILHNYVQQHLFDQALELSARLLHEFQSEFTFDQLLDVMFNRVDAMLGTERHHEALELLGEMEETLKQHDRPRDMAKLYNKLGTAHYCASDLLNAFLFYGHARQFAEKNPQDFLNAQIAYNLGNTLFWMNRPDEAMEHFLRAQNIFSEMARQGDLAQTLYMMGLCYNNENELERAEECLRQARSLYETQNMLRMSQRAREAYAFLVLGKTNTRQAKQELLSCLIDYKQMDEKSQVAFTYAELASLALQEGNFEEAERYLGLSDSFGFGRAVMKDSRAGFAYRVKAEYHLANKNYEESVKNSKYSFTIFDKIGYVQEAAKSLRVAGKAHELMGNISEALDLSNQVISMLQKDYMVQGGR